MLKLCVFVVHIQVFLFDNICLTGNPIDVWREKAGVELGSLGSIRIGFKGREGVGLVAVKSAVVNIYGCAWLRHYSVLI